MIELGGNIKLENFEDIDKGILVVVKKMVGNYVKKISEKNKNFKEIIIKKENNHVEIVCVCDKEIKAEAKETNLFFSLSKALEEVLGKC